MRRHDCSISLRSGLSERRPAVYLMKPVDVERLALVLNPGPGVSEARTVEGIEADGTRDKVCRHSSRPERQVVELFGAGLIDEGRRLRRARHNVDRNVQGDAGNPAHVPVRYYFVKTLSAEIGRVKVADTAEPP